MVCACHTSTMTRRPAPAGWPAMRTPGGGDNPLKAALYQRGRLVPWAKGLRDFAQSTKQFIPQSAMLVVIIDSIGKGDDSALRREGPLMAQQMDVLFFILTAAAPILLIPPLTPAAPIVAGAAGAVKIFNELFKSYLANKPPRPELLADAANLAGVQGVPRDTLAAAGPALQAVSSKETRRAPTATAAPKDSSGGKKAAEELKAKKRAAAIAAAKERAKAEARKKALINAAKAKAKEEARRKAVKGGLAGGYQDTAGADAEDKGGGVPLPLVLAGVGLALKVLS